jgi:hypothetical protein
MAKIETEYKGFKIGYSENGMKRIGGNVLDILSGR